MTQEIKNLNMQNWNKIKVKKLWTFSDLDKKELIRILWERRTNQIEKEIVDEFTWSSSEINPDKQSGQKEAKEKRKEYITKLLNKRYSFSNKWWSWDNSKYEFYDEWNIIITSYEWSSEILEFNGIGFVHSNRTPYRMITKAWNGYMWVIATLSDNITKEKVVKSKSYSILNNKWNKQYSLSEEPQLYNWLNDITIHKYKIKNNYKVFAIYDKDLNLLVKHVPEWFRVLSTLNWEILFQKEQLDIAGEDFVVMHQWDDREEKRVWEYALKDSPIYEEYISKLADDKK